LILAIAGAYFSQWIQRESTQPVDPTPAAPAAEVAPPTGYQSVTEPQPLTFPADLGAHPDYLTEWWYYTGNLETRSGRHFGYQFTIFRRSILPPDSRTKRESDWATDQVYMAHLAISDVRGSKFHAFERLSRGAAGLAGAQPAPYRVWLYDWQVSQVTGGEYRLRASEGDLELDLTLNDEKGPILHGIGGYSQKGPQPGNASMYVSQTRLLTSGTITLGEEVIQVSGNSWMDHEYSTSALSQNQVGWDWFAIQLENNSELMVYQIRRADGTIDPFSGGTFIDQDGSTTRLGPGDYSITALDIWKSSHSQAVYPSKWRVTVESLDLELVIEPYLADQELNLTYTYWEGAVSISGEFSGEAVQGAGYVELTGYKGSFAGEF
jgi:predicted secreted hydrolase